MADCCLQYLGRPKMAMAAKLKVMIKETHDNGTGFWFVSHGLSSCLSDRGYTSIVTLHTSPVSLSTYENDVSENSLRSIS